MPMRAPISRSVGGYPRSLIDCRMKSRTICWRWVRPCTSFSLLNARIQVKEPDPLVFSPGPNLWKSRGERLLEIAPRSLLPGVQDLRLEGLPVARRAVVVLAVDALHLVDEVLVHPVTERLRVL